MTTRQELLDACEAEARAMTDEQLREHSTGAIVCRGRRNVTRADLEAVVAFALFLERRGTSS